MWQLAHVKAVSPAIGYDGWMNRNGLLKQLAYAELDAQQVRERIRDQKILIVSLRAKGSNVSEAEQSLQAFERAQDNHLAEIERIKDALHKIR